MLLVRSVSSETRWVSQTYGEREIFESNFALETKPHKSAALFEKIFSL